MSYETKAISIVILLSLILFTAFYLLFNQFEKQRADCILDGVKACESLEPKCTPAERLILLTICKEHS